MIPDEPYGYRQLTECENMEELMAAWDKIRAEWS